MLTKEFLLQECENIKHVLGETLRYKYGLEGSKPFFDECEVRRAFIEQEILAAAENDYAAHGAYGFLLNELSGLISRIERSSLGEYSWPFVEEIKKITVAICTESTLTNSPPEVFVLSDGGLDSYSIHPELNRPSASKKRILTIVFPRTLKHFVLLHPILGHEIGHAVWRCSKHQSELDKIVKEELKNDGSIFSGPDSTANWLYQQNPPQEVQTIVSDLQAQGITEQLFFQWAKWDAWVEEIICDLIGLLSFGPSFVAAHCNLLYALVPAGGAFDQEHPPVGCRVNLINQASRLLGFDSTDEIEDGPLKTAITSFWASMDKRKKPSNWYTLFSDEQLTKTMDRISALLGKYPPTLYQSPKNELIDLFNKLLNDVPPVGYALDGGNGGLCRKIDFRHILYAGWLAKNHDTKSLPFLTLNRLCEHAIMQQSGIDKYLNGS